MAHPANIQAVASARYFVFMGVCGVGKSTIAEAVADRLAGSMIEADRLHPPENIFAMSEGRALDDAALWPWLNAVCDAARESGERAPVMIACSALKKRYRDLIRRKLGNVLFLHLQGPETTIRDRLNKRQPHFMPADMLESQIKTLESPADEADCVTLDIRHTKDELVADAIAICSRHLGQCASGGRDDDGRQISIIQREA